MSKSTSTAPGSVLDDLKQTVGDDIYLDMIVEAGDEHTLRQILSSGRLAAGQRFAWQRAVVLGIAVVGVVLVLITLRLVWPYGVESIQAFFQWLVGPHF